MQIKLYITLVASCIAGTDNGCIGYAVTIF